MRTKVSIYREGLKNFSFYLPDLSDGHRFFHVCVESVALLSGEYVENLDTSITLPCSDIFVVGIKTHAEGLLGGVTQSILMFNFDF